MLSDVCLRQSNTCTSRRNVDGLSKITKIPNQIDMTTAITTMIGAVLFSLVGAAVPAAKAADTDPVQALRYE